MVEQQPGRADRGEWIGDAAAGDIRRGAVDRLEDGTGRANVCRGGQPQPAAPGAGGVREDIPEEVGRDDHVEALRRAYHVVGRGIDQQLVDGNGSCLPWRGEDFERALAKQPARFAQHIRLVHNRNRAATVLPGVIEGESRDAPAAAPGDQTLGDGGDVAAVGDGSLLPTRVQSLAVLANDHHVDPRTGIGQRGRAHRPDAGEEIERLP